MVTEQEAAERQKRVQEELQQKEAEEAAAGNGSDHSETGIAAALGELPPEAVMDESSGPMPSDSESAASGDEDGSADDDDGFIAPDDASDGEDGFDEPKARGAVSKKKKKKEKGSGLRKLRRSKVDPLKAHSITKAMMGQRGAPPEEELINWAHHITPASVPDPMMRLACERMSRLRDGTHYVSFAFSCEVSGKQIGNVTYEEEGVERETAETVEFRKYSARCSMAPVMKDKGSEVKISADDAYEKHRKMVEEHEKKRRKRLGLRDDDDGDEAASGGRERRHSSRLTTRTNLSEDALAGQGAGGGEETEGRRKRHDVDALAAESMANMSAEDRAMAEQILQEERDLLEAGGKAKKRTRRGKTDEQAERPQRRREELKHDEADAELNSSPSAFDMNGEAAMEEVDENLSDSSSVVEFVQAAPAKQRPVDKPRKDAEAGDEEEEELLIHKTTKTKRAKVEHEEDDRL